MNKKSIWLDTVRVFATFAVILLHVSAPILYKYGEVPNTIWNIGNFYDSIVRSSVPLFFMISGALLLRIDYSLFDFLKKRFVRIIPPFIFWSLVYIIVDTFILGDQAYSIFEIFKLIAVNLIIGSKFHLWFIYTLLGIYLFQF